MNSLAIKKLKVNALFSLIIRRLKLLFLSSIKNKMSKPDTPQKNSSTVSTIHNTNYHSIKTSMYNTERRPKTANLVYANKPYKK